MADGMMGETCLLELPGCSVVCTSDDRQAWLDARMTGLGASDAWRLFDAPYALWASKSGHVPDEDLSGVEVVQWGVLLEGVVLAELLRRAGVGGAASGVMYRSDAHPWALATLDGWCVGADGETCAVEVKTAGAHHAPEWEDGAPPRYRWQVQHQMLVTGTRRALLGCLLGGQRLVWSWVERDEAMQSALVAAGAEMWRRICDDDAPPADGSSATTRALGLVYPTDDGETVALDGDLIDVGAELDAIALESKALDARKDAATNRVKAALGTSARGVLADGSGWTWTTQERAEHVVKASTSRVLRRTKSKSDKGGK